MINFVKEIFCDDLVDFVKTIFNRISNRETPKGFLLIAVVIGADLGLDLDTIESMFDGASESPIQLMLTFVFLAAYAKIIRK